MHCTVYYIESVLTALSLIKYMVELLYTTIDLSLSYIMLCQGIWNY